MRELNVDIDDDQGEPSICELKKPLTINNAVCTSGYGDLRVDKTCSECSYPKDFNNDCTCFVRISAVNDTKICSDIEQHQRYAVDQICGRIHEKGYFEKCEPGCCKPTCAGECCKGVPQTDEGFKFIPNTSSDVKPGGDDEDEDEDEDDGDEVTDVKTFIPTNVYNFLMFLLSYSLIVILILLALK